MKTLNPKKITVEQHHISEACKRDSHHCMIADAVRKSIPTAQYISVDLQTVRFTVRGERYTYLTPPLAQLALIAFDHGKKVKPFQFTLCQGSRQLAGWQAKHKGKSRKGKGYKKTNRKRLYKVSRFRQYGLKTLVK